MAYSPKRSPSYPAPLEPQVISCVLNNSAAATNIVIAVPWRFCTLSYAKIITTTVIDATGDMVVTLALDSSTGTTIGTITVPTASSAVGDVTELVVTGDAARKNLDCCNTSRDAINVNIDGSAAASGQGMLFLYFEAETNQ